MAKDPASAGRGSALISDARLHRDWLRRLPQLTGQSLSAIADAAGVARTTLTNKLKPGDPGTSTLNARVITRIVRAFGVPPPEAPPAPQIVRRPPGLAEDATPFDLSDPSPLAAAVQSLIAGRNGVDPWTLTTRALELIGYLPGDVVLVDLNLTARPGDAVCVQVYDWETMKAETLMRVYQRAAPVDLVVARSLDPGLQEPLVVDGERVIIKGVVLPHRLHKAA